MKGKERAEKKSDEIQVRKNKHKPNEKLPRGVQNEKDKEET